MLSLSTPKLSGKRLPTEGILNIPVAQEIHWFLKAGRVYWEKIITMFDLLLYLSLSILFLNCYMYNGMDLSVWPSINISVVTVLQVGVPVHCCWSCGSAEITYQHEDEFLNSGLQTLCASLAYSDDIISVANLYFSFGYPMSDLADHASNFPCFHDDSPPHEWPSTGSATEIQNAEK